MLKKKKTEICELLSKYISNSQESLEDECETPEDPNQIKVIKKKKNNDNKVSNTFLSIIQNNHLFYILK